MLMYSAAIIVGLALLIWGADLMVVGASVTARRFGVSPMLVGLTIVGFATSAPEILVAITAALSNAPNLAIGNAIGSNIANIGLIGGATAVAWPLVVHSQTLRRELPVMVAVSIVPAFSSSTAVCRALEGFLMLATFGGFMYWIVQLGLRTRGHDSIEAGVRVRDPDGRNDSRRDAEADCRPRRAEPGRPGRSSGAAKRPQPHSEFRT